MNAPYVSSRSGRFAWLMQRVSAVLLLILAFSHFFMQHFTADAVSTGLTVAARMNDPWSQAFYVVFIILALYHGINGLIGIIHDYAPKPLLRGIAAMLLWSLGIMFAILGILNVITPQSVDELKVAYLRDGLAHGESRGNPPGLARSYDLRQPEAELKLLRFYLDRHTARTDLSPQNPAEIFNDAHNGDWLARGQDFDRWASGPALRVDSAKKRDPTKIFASTREFAVWALRLRLRNAEQREDAVEFGRLDRLVDQLPAYSPDL